VPIVSDETRYRKALRNPSEAYERPAAVLRDGTLEPGQKLEILTHWEAEAIELQESEGEGFGGGERSLLTEIKDAIADLRDAD
jgi:hypothetical protein